ncbi:MAG: winged helix-turn-helix transcriptional regulator [Thermoplasmata archaeon]|nr:MAG: winged helix-turn-helix transcriptional regulator [Thermoplasmata archaeon]
MTCHKMNKKICLFKRNEVFYVYLALLFIIFFIIFLSSSNVKAAPPEIIIIDSAPEYINESSDPVCVFEITLTDDDGAMLENITITIENVSAQFDPNTDLAPLIWNESSGMMIYEESNAIPGFQNDDSPVMIPPTSWIGSGPWTTTFYGLNYILPTSTLGSNYYVVIRTNTSISNNEKFRIGIEPNNIWTYQGGIPNSSFWSKNITADTIAPVPHISAFSESSIAKVGDWLNITATIAGDDATIVTVNLSDFNGLTDSEPMIYDNGSRAWYYNITSLVEGDVDTDVSGYTFNVSATDKVGKIAWASNATIPIDTKSPAVAVMVNQENYPAGIGEWINITVTTTLDSTNVVGELSVFSGQGASQTFFGSGTNWYYNFTVQVGTLDGPGSINVLVVDDSGNLNTNDTQTADVDEVRPTVIDLEYSHIMIAGANETQNFYLNITYSEDMDTKTAPMIAFVNPTLVGTLTFSGGSWDGATIYRAIHIISDNDVEQLDVDIEVNGAWDLSGNSQTIYTLSDAFDVDTSAPIVTNIESSHILLTEKNVGNTFYLNITFSEDMEPTKVPMIKFVNPSLTGTLTFSGGTWDGTTIYRAQFLISDDEVEQFKIDIEVSGAKDVFGNMQITNITYDTFDVHTIGPTVSVIVKQESVQPGIGEWINITVITDLEVIAVDVDLASAGATGQIDDQSLVRINNTTWYYNFTVYIGITDASLGVSINVDAIDNMGNSNSNTANIYFDEVYPEPLDVTVTTGALGSNPAKIGDWINISVDVGGHTDIQMMYVTALGIYTSEPISDRVGNIWYLNTSVPAGNADGVVTFAITVIDDSNNQNDAKFDTAYIDNIKPEPLRLEIKVETQPAKVSDWINITLDVGSHLDIESINVDVPGVFSGEPITEHFGNFWYLNTSISQGTADGLVNFTVTLLDDAGNLILASDYLIIDNVPPALATIESISDGRATTPETEFRGVLTINAQTDANDILKVSFFDGDPNEGGIWLGDDFDSPYSFEWYTQVNDSGDHQIYIRVFDDAGNFRDSSGVEITISHEVKGPEQGIPLGLILLIGCFAAIGVGGVVVAATEFGKIPIFFFFYLLYTRLKKEYILDNFTRGRIYGYVEANPGEHFNAIKRALGLKNGSLAYHIRTLEKEGFIISKRDRGYKRFYPKSMKLPKRNVKELIPIQRNIMNIVKTNPGISQRGIADKLSISYQLVHYHIKVLMEADYVYLEKDEKQTYCYESEGHKLEPDADELYISESKLEDGTTES